MNQGSSLKYILQSYFYSGGDQDMESIKQYLSNPNFPDREAAFKNELRAAIKNGTLSPTEFEQITSVDQDSQEDINKFLLKELWQPLYGPEKI